MPPNSNINSSLELRPLRQSEHDAAARLIHRSLVHWYDSRLAQGARFGVSHEGFRIFPEVYEALDPGEAMAALDRRTEELLGICFVHPRPTHVAIGIVAVAPDAQSRGVARAMLGPTLEAAQASGRPVRLVSSLLNLDSFSLYSRLGFVPQTVYQDMTVAVPLSGLAHVPPAEVTRVTQVCDPGAATRLADFEFEWQGLRRDQDYAFFLANRVGDWRVWSCESSAGRLDGFLVASHHPACTMLGPGVARDEVTAAALVWRALDAMRGLSPVFLVPSQAHALVQRCYQWGARNVELHVAQTRGAGCPVRGIAFPTFLPESG